MATVTGVHDASTDAHLSLSALCLTVAFAAPASADFSKDASCSVSGFTGTVRMFYVSWNSTNWRLTQTQYKLAPANSASDQNNISQTLFGGSATKSLGNYDFAKRDALFHVHWDDDNVTSNYFALKAAGAYVSQKAIFDRSGSDPNCTVKDFFP